MRKQDTRSGRPQRSLRVGEIIRHALSDILAREDLNHPDLYGVDITVSEVRMSPDLRRATCYCARLGGQGEDSGPPVNKALGELAGFLRGRLGQQIALKFTPELHFVEDRSFDEAERIGRLLNQHRSRSA